MKKIRKYDGIKVYMFCNGEVATPEAVLTRWPAVGHFAHIVETDEAEEVCLAMQNLSVMRHHYGIDSSLTEDEAIAQIEVIVNTPPVDEPSAEERIASAMEFQNLIAL